MCVYEGVFKTHFPIIIAKISSLGAFDSFDATELIITFY